VLPISRPLDTFQRILNLTPFVMTVAVPLCLLLQLTDPFLQVFRGIIPPLGGIDLSVSMRGAQL